MGSRLENFDWGLRWEWTESAYLPLSGDFQSPGRSGWQEEFAEVRSTKRYCEAPQG